MDFLESASRIVEPINHIVDGYTDAQQGIDRSVDKTLAVMPRLTRAAFLAQQ